MSRRQRMPGALNPALGSIRSVQRVPIQFTGLNSADAGINTLTNTISAVDTDKAVVELISELTGHYYSGSDNLYAWGGLVLTSGTQVTGYCYVDATGGGGPYAITLMAQVTEYYATPKSRQVVQGAGASAISISTVDPDKTQIIPAYYRLHGPYVDPQYHPVLSASSLDWYKADMVSTEAFLQYQYVTLMEGR